MAKFVLGNYDFGSDQVVYYEGDYYGGGSIYGSVINARLFEYDELLDFLKIHRENLGFFVVRLEEQTINELKNNKELQIKYSTKEVVR